jgi:hypothetical protein
MSTYEVFDEDTAASEALGFSKQDLDLVKRATVGILQVLEHIPGPLRDSVLASVAGTYFLNESKNPLESANKLRDLVVSRLTGLIQPGTGRWN